MLRNVCFHYTRISRLVKRAAGISAQMHIFRRAEYHGMSGLAAKNHLEGIFYV